MSFLLCRWRLSEAVWDVFNFGIASRSSTTAGDIIHRVVLFSYEYALQWSVPVDVFCNSQNDILTNTHLMYLLYLAKWNNRNATATDIVDIKKERIKYCIPGLTNSVFMHIWPCSWDTPVWTTITVIELFKQRFSKMSADKWTWCVL